MTESRTAILCDAGLPASILQHVPILECGMRYIKNVSEKLLHIQKRHGIGSHCLPAQFTLSATQEYTYHEG